MGPLLRKYMQSDYYLKVGTARDLKSSKDRAFFRFFEIFPGLLSWGTIILAVILSWQKPVWIAVFIIFFDLYWFFRTIYFSFHLQSGYKKMREHEQANWLLKLEGLEHKTWKDIYHLIILPMYEEPLEIVRETFKTLEGSDFPKDRMIIVLACEDKVRSDVQKTADAVSREFGSKFYKFILTWHPADLPNEIAGKGSNETWAAKHARTVIDSLQIPYENIIYSSFDIDTCVFPKYFSCLTFYYLTAENPDRCSFQPIPLYINNIWQASGVSRVFSFSSTFWHTMNQERPEKLITFSSHSMSFKTLVDVGFRQTNVVSDDSRIFWQCFLQYDGDYRVVPIYYPISMDSNVASSFTKTMVNIYKQQRRWAYGVGDIAYFMFGFPKNKKIPVLKKISLAWELIQGHWSWATSAIMIFLLGWLPLILGGPNFAQNLLSYNLPKITSAILTVSMLGLIISAYFSIVLMPPKPIGYGRTKYFIFILEWILVPFSMIFFNAVPAIDAQTRWLLGKYMGFWPTEKVRKLS